MDFIISLVVYGVGWVVFSVLFGSFLAVCLYGSMLVLEPSYSRDTFSETWVAMVLFTAFIAFFPALGGAFEPVGGVLDAITGLPPRAAANPFLVQ